MNGSDLTSLQFIKAGDPKLTSLPSKLLDRFVYNKLLHLLTNSLLHPHQFGFRPGNLTTSWHKYLDSKLDVAAIFFDLSKAFDTVPHQGLLQALSNVDVSGKLHEWFKKLPNRKSAV